MKSPVHRPLGARASNFAVLDAGDGAEEPVVPYGLVAPVPHLRHGLEERLNPLDGLLSRLVAVHLPPAYGIALNPEEWRHHAVRQSQSPASSKDALSKRRRRQVRVVPQEANDRPPMSNSGCRLPGFPVPYSVRADSQACGRLSLGALAVEPGALEVVPQSREVSGIGGIRRQRYDKRETAKG